MRSATPCTRPERAATTPVKDPEKLKRIAGEWGVETEGKDIYDLAHEVAEIGPDGVRQALRHPALPQPRSRSTPRKLWHEAGIEPRAIDREVSQSLHMTHMGCSSLPEALIRQALRCGLCDGWGGSMCGTEFSDVMFGTPKPVDTTANLGVMEKDMVNIVVHGHDPSLSEMIVLYAQDPEMIALAKEQGAKGINICRRVLHRQRGRHAPRHPHGRQLPASRRTWSSPAPARPSWWTCSASSPLWAP